ncbi:Uncharacterised protein [Burkholderia pseudomallei]|nr:Uncharacterised protein [Burkholderia pseudomallei]
MRHFECRNGCLNEEAVGKNFEFVVWNFHEGP